MDTTNSFFDSLEAYVADMFPDYREVEDVEYEEIEESTNP